MTRRFVAVVGDFPVVSKTFVTDQLVGLLDAGHEVLVIADEPDPRQSLAPDDVPEALRGRILDRTSLRYRRLPGRIRTVITILRGLRRAPRATIDVLRRRRLPLHRRRASIEMLLALHAAGDADIFHCHFGTLGPDVAAARDHLGYAGRVVVAFHGSDISSHVATNGPGAFDELFRSGALLLPISDHWRTRLLELGASPEQVVIHRMGVHVSRFDFEPRVSDPQRALRVLSVGRMVEKKGFVHGLAAVAQVHRSGRAIEYTIVGDGPLRESLHAEADRLGVRDRVRFAGPQPRERVYELMQDNDVFLCPSVTAGNGDKEGIPMVLMEAMASGIPVVSSFHSGIPELVEDGVSGLLATEGDHAALAESVLRIAEDPALARGIATNGRRRVEREFDVDMLVTRLASLCASDQHPRPAP